MGITDLYEASDWTDIEGPGCGYEGHSEQCLCDVDLAAHPVPANATIDFGRDVGCGVIATKAAGTPTTGSELCRWAAELLGSFDAIKAAGCSIGGGTEMLERLRSLYFEARALPKGRFGSSPYVRDLLAAGLTIAATARYLETTELDIVRQFNAQDDIDPVPYLAAEPLLRSGIGFAEVARATGLDKNRVRRFAEALGIESKHAAGGGYKYGKDTYEQILRMRGEGKSYTAIAEALDMNRNTVVGVVRRRKAAAA